MAEKKKKTRRRKKSTKSATAILKAKLLGNEGSSVPHSNLLDLDERAEQTFNLAGAIEPPIPPLVLVRLFGVSNSLRQNIDAMTTNIDGFGHTFESVIDLKTNEGREDVKTAMILEREMEADFSGDDQEKIDLNKVEEPTDQEIDARIEQLKTQSRRELARAKVFFDNVSPEFSFVKLRNKMRIDKESTGYAAWEILRDRRSVPRHIVFAPSWTLRALPRDHKPTSVNRIVRTTDISWEEEEIQRFFRRYVQDYEGRVVYFKEFGDPRVMSSVTGNHFDDMSALEKDEPGAAPATELIWFRIESPESEIYGGPRYAGNILSVIGSREMEEVNYAFWEHKAIPPMVIMVSGGHLAKGAEKKLEAILEDQIKGGREKFHKVLILQAEPIGKGLGSAGAISSQSKVKIELRPLLDAIWKEQIWGEYDKGNRLKVGQSFRIPPIIRGETQDFNRATAEAAKDFVEEQVFQPERTDFDFEMNRTIMMDLRIMLWRFKTRAPVARQPDKVVEFAKTLAEGVIKVNEGRRVVQDAVGIDLPKIDAPWAEMPLKQSIAGFAPEGESAAPEPNKPSLSEQLERNKGDDESATVVNISQDLMNELVIPDDR